MTRGVPRYQRPDAETLARLYAEAGSERALGRRLGVAPATAQRWLEEAGVARRPVGAGPAHSWRHSVSMFPKRWRAA